MSRTFRRKDPAGDLYWLLTDYQPIPGSRGYQRVKLDPRSIEGIKKLARYHSDSYDGFSEPGPAWFRNLMTERPQRREGKRELRKFMAKPDEYEVILNAKNPLEYWT